MSDWRGGSRRRLRISDVLLFAWDVLWITSFFASTDRDGAFETYFDFAGAGVVAASLPFVLFGDVSTAAVYLFAFMNGVAVFTGATALLAYVADAGVHVPRLQLVLTASLPYAAALLWGSAARSIRESAHALRHPGNLASADPVRVVLAATTWVVAPTAFAATLAFDVPRVLFWSGLCADGARDPEGDPCAEWDDACTCDLLYVRHLVIIALSTVCLTVLIVLELLRTPNRGPVVLAR